MRPASPQIKANRAPQEDRLPAGAKILESTKFRRCIEIIPAARTSICAQETSFTAQGISFQEPCELKNPRWVCGCFLKIIDLCFLSKGEKATLFTTTE
jgi:hypothetical protein